MRCWSASVAPDGGVDDLLVSFAKLQDKYENLQNRHTQCLADLVRCSFNNRKLFVELEDAKETLRVVMEKRVEADAELVLEKAKVQSLTVANGALKELVDKLVNEGIDKGIENKRLNIELEKLQSKCNGMAKNMADVRARLHAAKDEISGKDYDIDCLKAELERKDQMMKRWKEPVFEPADIPFFKCPLTLEDMVEPVSVTCGHVFERSALESWMHSGQENRFKCPMCRTPFSLGLVPYTHMDELREVITEIRRLETNLQMTLQTERPALRSRQRLR